MSLRSFLRGRLARGAALLGMALALAACDSGPPQFRGSDITGTRLGRDLALVDHAGVPRTLADYAGKVVVVFFGFTQCPDVCPTSLAEMAQVAKTLGEDAKDVQVLMVTVDPERDTPDVLRQYVTAFDPRFVGLTGTPEQIKQAAASFKVYYAKVPREGGDYTMDHTAAFYVLDKQGEARVLLHSNAGVDAMVHDIRQLL
jgi:Uncharacterized protein SCO1/SenC/PrrC, involved in biogenesis of respiratory and photosynthetic systems